MRDDGGAAWQRQGRGTGEATVEDLIGRGLLALGGRRSHTFDDVTVDLAQRCASSDGARRVVTALVAGLRAATDGAWQRGWQPSDVHRMAVRRLSTAEQAFVVDAMTDELDRHARATVDPSWWGQLHALDGTVWWPRSETWLDAHRQRGVDWLTLVAQSLTVMNLLQSLPGIERLTCLPGEFRPTAADAAASATSGRPADVDSRILERVRMLLAKAESTTFAAEAETFTAGAQALMARHSIDAALLTAERGGASLEGGPRGRRIGIDTPYDGPKASLLTAVASANNCRMVWTRELGFGTVVGFEADLESVELLFTSLLVQANSAMLAEGSRADHRGRSRTRAFRSSFLTAFAYRIGERLRQVTREAMDAAAPAATSRGQALVPLMAARTERVEQTVDEWFPSLTRRRTQSVRDAEGWHVGRAAADRARLDGPSDRSRVGRGRS
ncbi:DUF2786 domain-containing protein [Knoellia aerolata]|uniref:Uncharacterized protein n=1 Tax=Knoellia aerolata DSM 18566 TaxID=1385519 RepID=A0A0A0K2W6_9MICO|nr:DUF2786 domain-containing protein [Knoellia aerolata]KGN42652.1 hypothetical protein N801_14020 [Knoellia aerolata DSM 18566]